jgi:signal peptidase I
MNPPKNKPGQSVRRPSDSRQDAGDAWLQTSAWSRTLRETVESIAIAFMLAFLFRTFEAEAFVIPTGSMAPTLMGKHLDITCPMCKFEYRVGTPGDEDEEAVHPAPPPGRDTESRNKCICPNCGFTLNFADMKPAELAKFVYYNGDRILVSKFAYDFSPPERWDVIVFKFPEDAKTNYIKRLVGLPNDVIRIRNGDIAVSHDDGKTFAYAPRSPGKLRSMLQMVFDDDHAFRPFVAKGWPAALQSDSPGALWTAVASNSKEDFGPTAFFTTGKSPSGAPAEAWLRYFHYVPNGDKKIDDWGHFKKNLPLTFVDPDTGRVHPQPKAITDDNPYDTPARDRQELGDNVPVDDLAVEFQVDVQQAQGKLAVELVKQGQRFQCMLDLAAGSAEMVIPGSQPPPKAASGGISKAGSHRIFFANVDHQLTLLVDDKKVAFDPPAVWSDVPPGSASAGSPAAIGSIGAALQVNHFRILRDIFYTYDAGRTRIGFPEYRGDPPKGWPEKSDSWVCYPVDCVDRLRQAGADVRESDQFFFLGDNQFFTLGDNSRLSQDGRFWPRIHFVDRRLLIGKALVIYWPHSFDKVTIFGHDIPLPFWPNFSRMGFVR